MKTIARAKTTLSGIDLAFTQNTPAGNQGDASKRGNMATACKTSRWGERGFCGFGNCTDLGCVCEPGWVADRTFYKADNCYLPEKAMLGMQIAVGIVSFIVGCYGVMLVRQLKTEARMFAAVTTSCMFCTSAYMLAHGLEGNTHGYAASILCVLSVRLLSDAFAIALHALLKPVFKFAGGKEGDLRVRFIYLQVVETIAFLGCLIAMLVSIGKGDDEAFSNSMASFVVIFSTHFAMLVVLIAFPTWEVVKGIRTNSSSSKGATGALKMSGRADDATRKLVRKIKIFIRASTVLGPGILIITMTFALLQFIMASAPVIWVFYFIILLQFPVLGMVQFHLAKPRSKVGGTPASSVVQGGAGNNSVEPQGGSSRNNDTFQATAMTTFKSEEGI